MLETAREQSYPKLTQISFFLPNRVGSLQRVVHVLEQAHIAICGLSIVDAHDHAVVHACRCRRLRKESPRPSLSSPAG